MADVYAVIGGSGFNTFEELENVELCDRSTPYGDASSGLVKGKLNHHSVCFVPRHGSGHKIAPHNINFRANIYRLKSLGVSRIIAINAVGGIADFSKPGAIVIPDQLIDYTYGRKHTFYDSSECEGPVVDSSLFVSSLLDASLDHIDFTYPFSPLFRNALMNHMRVLRLSDASSFYDGAATYGCTQGPRLETAAEIHRMTIDGCHLVGMTAMPEAALARELDIEYISICVSVNWAAGIGADEIKMADIIRQLEQSVADVKKICTSYFSSF